MGVRTHVIAGEREREGRSVGVCEKNRLSRGLVACESLTFMHCSAVDLTDEVRAKAQHSHSDTHIPDRRVRHR